MTLPLEHVSSKSAMFLPPKTIFTSTQEGIEAFTKLSQDAKSAKSGPSYEVGNTVVSADGCIPKAVLSEIHAQIPPPLRILVTRGSLGQFWTGRGFVESPHHPVQSYPKQIRVGVATLG